MTNKYICIHGHFYQPPRENAWLETIEIQESASPFHDWNERITEECYGPNAASRILDDEKNITNIVNNYANMSFNFGATLLSWLEEHKPEVYFPILEADHASQQKFSGHGNALAQVYNHIIMPLANEQDKITQVVWGIADFEHRFNRKPEGMWLAETAVDLATLEVLVDYDIKFTILAPQQAHKAKLLDAEEWINVNGSRIDTKKPYWCKLPSGRSIALFFYDGHVAKDVAFQRLLNSGKNFAYRLAGTANMYDDNPQIINIATDGESYGHHHKHGDMALSYAIGYIESHELAHLTNYGEFLEKFPPKHEVLIHEDSSWSCVHGIERWRSNCGCTSNDHHHQLWRAPLREALNWLRDELKKVYEQEMKSFTAYPWEMRDAFIEVILDRSEEKLDKFLADWCRKPIEGKDRTKIVRMLEMQRHALLMFTSCGWFFDDIARIEAQQILQYAARAIQLAGLEANIDLEPSFLELLALAPCNDKTLENGADVYNKYVISSKLSLYKVSMQHAVYSLFEDLPENIEVLNYKSESGVLYKYEAGQIKMVVGKVRVRSKITYAKADYSFGALYLGQHNIVGNTSEIIDDETFEEMHQKMKEAFYQSRIVESVYIMNQPRYLHKGAFTFWDLLKEEQRKILRNIAQAGLEQAESSYHKIYDSNYHLMNVLKIANLDVPRLFRKNLEVVINSDLRAIFGKPTINLRRLEELVKEIKKWDVDLDKKIIGFEASNKVYEMISGLKTSSDEIRTLETLKNTLHFLQQINIGLDLWKIQNQYFKLGKQIVLERADLPPSMAEDALQWWKVFKEVGIYIKVKMNLDALID
ncbi:MAG: DUF3536 domain-containing protein [Chitinophagales bacterium]